jgi:ATP phosphoribosyltransferase regulatory subunit
MNNGLTDILRPDERAVLRLRRLYELHGYRKYKMGRFEEYRLYLENKSFLASEHVITFTDLDGRLMALKPDVTLSIVKNIKADAVGPERLYYIENIYRPKDRSYKEISQAGLELIGGAGEHAVAEVVVLARQTLEAVSPAFVLALNHIGFAGGLLDSLDLSAGVKVSLRAAIEAKSAHAIKALCAEHNITGAAKDALLALPALHGEPDGVLSAAGALAFNETMREAAAALSSLCETLGAVGLADMVRLDLSALADETYYNGIVFKGYIQDLPYTVLSGGQYDKLLQSFGKNAGAVGFALYLDELERLPGESAEESFDVAYLYDPAAHKPAAVAAAVRGFTEKGLRVWSGTKLPPELPYKKLVNAGEE